MNKFFQLLILVSVFATTIKVNAQREQDSLALVALYNATDGANWNNNTNWLSSEPINTWYGVEVINNRVINLWLGFNGLMGSIPSEIGNLANLSSLNLSGNQLSGSIPVEIENLTNLTNLYLSENRITGSIPAEIGNLANLTKLWLSNNQLTGSIPAEIGNLANLTDLELSNNQLSGSIPAEIGSLSNLQILYLDSNQFSGVFPDALLNLNLVDLGLGYNQLSGSIPPEIWNQSNLQGLNLAGNQFTGSIPPEIGNLSNLTGLYLGDNQLTGLIPSEIGNLINLQYFFLGGNQFTGSIPPEIGNLTNLRILNLVGTSLYGSIPPEIGNLINITQIFLEGNQFTSLPALTLSALSRLSVDNNKLTFDDIVPNIGVLNFTYSPQDSIGIKIDTIGYVGQEISFTVNGGGDTWQWYKDGVPLANGGRISGVTNYTLSLTNLDISDEGVYHCKVRNSNAPALTLYSRPTTLSVSTSIETVTDIDGNVYNTVKIGTQTWMQENLKTTKYRNGDFIGTTLPFNLDLISEAEPKYQWSVTEDEGSVESYGRLYTWYAATDSRNVCPLGWHLPSEDEWTILRNYLEVNGYGYEGSGNDIAKSMATTSGWSESLTASHVGNDQVTNNSIGFSGVPSGARHRSGVNNLIGKSAYFWSSSENAINPLEVADNHFLRHDGMYLEKSYFVNKKDGYSVRCLKDSEPEIILNVQDATINQGQSLEVPIIVTDLAATDNIISYQFDIEYDNSVLSYTGNSVVGTLAAGGTVEVNTSVAGKLSVSYMTSTAFTGTGDILKLQFNTLKADTTDILISNAYLNATSVTNLTNGIVIVKDVTPPTAKISYNDSDIRCADNLLITATFSEPMLVSNAVKISLGGAALLSNIDITRLNDTVYTYTFLIPNAEGQVNISLSNGRDLWGNEVISTPTSGGSFTIIPISYGDVDDDGKILAYDAALTLQHSVGIDPLPSIDPLPWENWRDTTANVDGVNGITANDAGMILQYSAGIINTFDAQNKKSFNSEFADVSIEVVGNDIIFYSSGELLGLNISTSNENQILGNPVLLADNFMSAFNTSGLNYQIGICTAITPSEGLALLKIPYDKKGSVTFNMNINRQEKIVSVDLLTGKLEFSDNNIILYPNPATDILKIRGLNSPTTARIYNTNGKLLLTSKLNGDISEINVSVIPVGVYVIELQTNKEMVVKRFEKL